jgi:hypothetical protein
MGTVGGGKEKMNSQTEKEIKSLINSWYKRAEKCLEAARIKSDPIIQEGLFCASNQLDVCASQLERVMKYASFLKKKEEKEKNENSKSE